MRSFASILFVGSLLGACDNGGGGGKATTAKADASKPADIGETIAKVNGTPIGSKEFEDAASRKTAAEGGALSAAEKKEVADRMVEDELLYEEALKRGLDKDPKVKKVMVNTLLREEVYANVRSADFTDQELQTYFEAHKDEFIVPEKVQIKRILIKVSDERPDAEAKKLADSVHTELVKKPDSFKDLAEKNSEDPYKRRGGDVGFVAKTGKPGLDQAVVDKAFELQNNQISDVFKTDEGYNIISVANRRYVAKLKTDAKIEIDEAKLASIEVQGAKQPTGPGMSLGGPGGGPMRPGVPGMEKTGADEMAAGVEDEEAGEGAAPPPPAPH
jgi:hypothetical protein